MAETTLGQRIAAKRAELGLSQNALGEQLGVSRQSVFKWESDAAIPEIDKLIALSRLFGVTVGWLLGIEEDPAPRQPRQDFTEREKKLIEQLTSQKPVQPRWQKWLTVAAAVCAAVSLVLSGFALYRNTTINRNLEKLMSQFMDPGERLGYQGADMVSGFTYDCTPSLDLGSVEVAFDITPRIYNEENECSLLALLNGEQIAQYDCVWNGSQYRAEFTLEPENGYQFLFCVEDTDGDAEAAYLSGTALENLDNNMKWPENASVKWKSLALCGDALEFTDMTVDIPLPGIFRDQRGLWEKCDLVLTNGSGEELDRLDLMNRSAYSAQIDFGLADVSFTTRSQRLSCSGITVGDTVILTLDCGLTSGHQFSYAAATWEMTADGLRAVS